jgi:hypothetical protein
MIILLLALFENKFSKHHNNITILFQRIIHTPENKALMCNCEIVASPLPSPKGKGVQKLLKV